MKRVINRKLIYAFLSLSVALILCFVFSFSQNKAFANQNKYGNYVPGKAIVCVDGGANALNTSNSANTLGTFTVSDSLMTLDSSREVQELIGAYSSNLKNQLFNIKPQYAYNNSSKQCEILLVDCEDTEKFVENASKVNCILWAQPDYIMQTNEIKDAGKIDEAPANTTPDPNLDTDPLFKYQWAYDGNNIGSASTNIGALDTWKAEESDTQDYSSVVAVIDTGVDYEHPDLKANMWGDGNTIPALTALGGGKYGIDTVEDEDSTDPMDRDNGHGTHCASSIASPFNNVGVMGVNGNNAKIMGCRFMNTNGGPTSGAIKCFNYIITAKKNDVNVSCISNSWGDSDSMSVPNFALESVTNEAGLNGIVTCFSAGNDTYNMDDYPYRIIQNPYTINIGSCDDYGAPSSFSNYGEHTVDLFSPGNRMLNCVSRYEGIDTSRQQYLSWINPEEDSYFHENFKSQNPKILMSSHLVDNTRNVISGQVNAEEECGSVDLTSYKEGDRIHVQLDIKKSDLQALIDSGVAPYYSFLYQLEDVEIVNNRFGVRYIDGEDEPPLSTTWISRYNHDRDMCIQDLENNDFYKVSGDKVSLEAELDLTYVGPNAKFNLYDFGFGKNKGIYGYKNGTSMACPVVSGIVSHIYPRFHATSAEDAKNVIAYVKGSTKDLPVLADKSINPGVVNLKSAYDAVTTTPSSVHPVVDSIELSNNADGNISAVLHGYFFGVSRGVVQYDGTTIDDSKISYWSDREVRFVIPDCNEHLAKFSINRTDGKSGRNYFVAGNELSDFVNLPVSNFSYNVGESTIKTEDMNVLRSATTENAMYCLYGAETGPDTGLMVIERFDFATSTWSSIDLSNLNIMVSGYNYYYSMASGKDEIYLLYQTKDGPYKVATYSESLNTIISDADLPSAHYGDMIGNINGELYLMGRVCSIEKSRDFDMVKIYPDTGVIYENVGDFPYFDEDYETYNDVACGNVSVYGDYIYISDCFMLFNITEEGSTSDIYFGGPVFFDGSNWKQGSYSMYYDVKDQMLRSASYATSFGLISNGIWNDATSNELKDTWTYSVNDDIWTLTNYKFSDVKCRSFTGTCHNNNFYILGQRSLVNDIAFRYLPLSKVGATSQNVTLNVAKGVNPTPGPVPIFIDSSAATGDSLNNIICLAIILFMSSFLICYLRKSRVKL